MPTIDNRIKVLSTAITEKIAAGEVIERPGSVVKELVENSIDAGSTRIDISVEEGGFSKIRISDNGCGMGVEDLRTSLLRHATSKISRIEDLYAIATLGFRGEALASISAVSRVSIACSATQEGLGYEIHSEGGVESPVVPCQHTRGTTITCRDLFFNVPARKKFMKSTRAEAMAIMRLVEQIVIPFPAIHFTLTVDGLTVLEAPMADTLAARIAQVAGTEFAGTLLTAEAEAQGVAATIYISPPDGARPRPRFQLLYVNLRRIDSDAVTFSIREAFSRFITAQLKPAWFCFMEIDPSRVDVNVHPTKQRIKFDDEKAVFRFIYNAVHGGIARKIAPLPVRPPAGSMNAADISIVAEVKSALAREWETTNPIPGFRQTTGGPPETEPPADAEQTTLPFFSIARGEEKKELEQPADSNVRLSEEQWELIHCYQIHRTYILATIKNGILLIDQHAAHERILYEQALADMLAGRAESQRLLFPVIMEFSPMEKAVAVSGRDHFNALGFDIQDFGGASVAVSATPAAGFIKEYNIEEALREMVTYLIEEKDNRMVAKPQKRFAAAYACGAAIKAGQVLKQDEMNALLNSLFSTENPYICPHGRPTVVRISMDELSRRFLR
jgi:DNA mismatch repair protein MutL